MKTNIISAIRSVIALLAVGLGMLMLLVAGGLVDGTGSTGEVTAVSLLALLSVGGGIIGLRMEAYDAIK
ncbi:MAG: hypothetical protein GX763_09655 [Clostridiaceae bacterium]|nr:hypothetical protein [Clostridiaceae bacterium]